MPCCFLPDLTGVKSGSACLPLGRRYSARPPGRRCRIYDHWYRPNPPFPTPRVKPGVAFGKSDRSTCHWQVDQTVLWHQVFTGGAGVRDDWLCHHTQHPPIPFCFLPDLTRVKSGSACPPLGRRYSARPPGQALPNFQPQGSPQPPFPCACASGNRTDQPATGRLFRRSSGTRILRAVRVTRGDRPRSVGIRPPDEGNPIQSRANAPCDCRHQPRGSIEWRGLKGET